MVISQKLFISSIVFFLLLLCTASCNTTEPPTPPDEPIPVLKLELEDVSCTEAWITLTTTDLILPAELTLKQYNPTGDSLSQVFILNTQDSLLYIDSLLPNQNYSFQVFSLAQANQHPASSIKLPVTTMDTTSHNFTFEMITFGGEIGSSVLYDVAIIDESNIIAVGDIWIKDDTSSLGYTKYNAVHWDGNRWELKRIYFPTVCGQTDVTPYPAKSIFVFNGNEIWISSSGDKIAILINGEQTEMFCLPPNVSMSINKIWGRSSNDLYVVGYAGYIAYFNGTSWSKIESNTTLNINDIWGDYNEKTQQWEILALASNKFFNEGFDVLKIIEQNSTILNTNGLPWSISSVWFKAGKKYFIAGDGLFFNKKINEDWNKDSLFIPIYKDRIRGISINDIVVSGSNGLLSHFNGYSWKHYINNELPYFSGRLFSVDINQNITVTVGRINSQAIITIGRR